MQLNISSEKIEIAQKLLKYIKGGTQRAVSMSLNRVIEGVKTDLTNETKMRYFAKPNDIRKTFNIKKGNAQNLQSVLTSRGTRKNLSEYFISPKMPKKNQKGLQAAVKRDGAKNISGAFLIKRNGGYKAYLRTGRGRFSIEPVISPAVPQILKNPDTVKVIEEKASERFSKRLDHEISRILGTL